MILPIGTLGTNQIKYMKYTSECIPKLQIHQHSLLTRKVFSRRNLSSQVFFSISSGSSSSPRHLQFIFIFKSYSSRSISSLNLDHHHWIWIITRYGSSSLDLDHHCWIITGHHHGCYLMILLVTEISTEPSLFHAGCRPSLHVGLF